MPTTFFDSISRKFSFIKIRDLREAAFAQISKQDTLRHFAEFSICAEIPETKGPKARFQRSKGLLSKMYRKAEPKKSFAVSYGLAKMTLNELSH